MLQRRERILPIMSGIGSGYGFLVWRASRDAATWSKSEWLQWLMAFALVALLSWVLIEPLRERIRFLAAHAEAEHTSLSQRSWLVLLLPFPVLLGIEFTLLLFHHQVSEHPFQSWADMVAAMVISGGITYEWLRAVHRHPPRPALRGFLAGLILGVLYVWCQWAIHRGQLIDSRLGRLEPMTFAMATTIGVGNGLLLWGLLGLCGGLALHGPRILTPALRVALALLLAAVASDALLHIYPWPDVLKVVGWGAALWLYHLPGLAHDPQS